MKCGPWIERWFKARQQEDSTRAAARSRLDNHVLPRWAETMLAEVYTIEVQEWVRELDARLAPATVHACYNLLSAALDAAAHQHPPLIPMTPCVDIKLPPIPPGKEVFLTRAQVDLLIELAPAPYGDLILLLAYTGLRLGEALGLRVGSLDLDAGYLEVRHVRTRHGDKEYPKGRRRRFVPLPGRLVKMLRRRVRGKTPAAYVFTSAAGTPLSDTNFRGKVWDSRPVRRERKDGTVVVSRHVGVVERAGLADLAPTPHDLRHTYASWLVQGRGEDDVCRPEDAMTLGEVQELLGHESIKTTERYAHLAPNRGDRARRLLGAR